MVRTLTELEASKAQDAAWSQEHAAQWYVSELIYVTGTISVRPDHVPVSRIRRMLAEYEQGGPGDFIINRVAHKAYMAYCRLHGFPSISEYFVSNCLRFGLCASSFLLHLRIIHVMRIQSPWPYSVRPQTTTLRPG